MGQITLSVTFGNLDNFRTEDISFEVVPFKSAYHAIFGRPAYARFMAWPCYIYNKLKMPEPKRIITISGDFKKAKECKGGNAACVEAVLSKEELEEFKKEVKPDEMPAAEKPSYKPANSLKASDNTKKDKLTSFDPSKQTTIGTGLDDK